MKSELNTSLNDRDDRKPSGSIQRWVLIGFLAVAAFLLIVEHRAHVFGILPYLILLACPLMHIFMHRGHGGSHKHGSDGDST